MSDKSDKTSLGDRMKSYEQPTIARRAFKGQPLVVRLDGKSFHTFTKGLKRPYDAALSELMRETMLALVDRFQATVGYTQSDEISLVWVLTADDARDLPFAGNMQKIESLMAAYCSVFFNSQLPARLPQKARPGPTGSLATFDARAFMVPTVTEAYNCLLWRQQDATKNAISMAAQSMFSHKSLQGLHGPEMQEKMFAEKGVNFNDYPAFFKRGVFGRRVSETRTLSDEDYARIPEEHWPFGGVITRTSVKPFDCWLAKEDDGRDVLFYGAEPKVFVSNPNALVLT